LVFAVACGSAAQTEDPAPPAAAEPAAPAAATAAESSAPAAAAPAAPAAATAAEPAAPAAAADPTATPVVAATPVPGVYEAEVPEWVSIGAGKHYNGTIRFVHRANPGFLDLHYGASSTTVLLPSGPRFNQLLQYDPTNPSQIMGDLAESWEVSDDGLTLTFNIHEANWQDGVPVTADDIVFSLDRMSQEGVTRGRVTAIRDFYEHGSARAVDDRTVEMPLKFASSTALGWLAVDYYKIYARHVVESKTQDELNCCFENNVGSGPWVFKDWKKGDSWEYERNNDYFMDPIPFYDGFKVFVIEDAARRLASMKTGQVEAWLVMGGTTLKDMLQIQKETDGRMRAVASGAGSVRGFWLHLNRPPLDDPRVRKAIYLALDRNEIAEIAAEGEGILGNFFPPGYAETDEEVLALPGLRYEADGSKYAGDLAEAKQLLTAAGYPEGFKLTFNVDQAKQGRTEAELIAAQLKDKLNIDVELQSQDRATFYANLRDASHNMSIIGTGLYFLEPQTVLVQWYAKDTLRNPHNWENPRMNELMQVEARELDPEVRRGYYKEMAEILNEGDGHYIVLYWQGRAGAIDYRIQNFRPPYHPHTIWRWDQIWWDESATQAGGDAPPLR
jgi:peptide/nickel transport system substrate-binding protein